MENFDQANQWKLNGECAKCRRRNYCHRDCTAKRKRDEYWKHPEKLMHKVVELQYFEVTNNKDDDSISLRFPIWLGKPPREDKSLETMSCI